jgi:hypothetical protein
MASSLVGEQILLGEANRALRDACGRILNTQDRKREHRLAGAAFADEAERRAGVEFEAHVLERADDAAAGTKLDR